MWACLLDNAFCDDLFSVSYISAPWHWLDPFVRDSYVNYRMTSACQKKCIPTKYREADLSKGEAVCLDRCVAKYLEIHERIGKRLTSISMQEEETFKKLQQPQ